LGVALYLEARGKKNGPERRVRSPPRKEFYSAIVSFACTGGEN